MKISPVSQFCLVAYVWLSVQAVLTSANPVKQINKSVKWRRYCEMDTLDKVKYTCMVIQESPSDAKKGDDDQRVDLSVAWRKLIDTCYKTRCTREYMLNYCELLSHLTSTVDIQDDYESTTDNELDNSTLIDFYEKNGRFCQHAFDE